MVYFTIFGTVPRVTVSEYLPTRYVAYLWEAVNLDAAGLAVALSSVIGVSFDWLIFFLNLFSSFLYFLVFLSVSLYPNSIKIKIRSLLHIFQRFIVFLFLYFFPCLEYLRNIWLDLEKMTVTEQEVTQYDRQIRLWGLEAQNRLRTSKILLFGLKPLGAEICKNLVLAGIGEISVCDSEPINEKVKKKIFL